MNQKQRDKRAIRTVLNQLGPATYADIALRAGEGLYQALDEMVQTGEVSTTSDAPKTYSLTPK